MRRLAVGWFPLASIALAVACTDTFKSEATFEVPPTAALVVGERTTVQVITNYVARVTENTCAGIADTTIIHYGAKSAVVGETVWVQNSEVQPRIELVGRGPGACRITFRQTVPPNADFLAKDTTHTLAITVAPPNDQIPTPDAGDAGDAGGPEPICTVPVGRVGEYEGRDWLMAYTTVDSLEPNEPCPLHTSTDFRGDVVFGFIAGSPGYSIDGRGTYRILSASPATLHPDEASADALEGNVVTFSFTRRLFGDEDAGPDAGPPPVWTFVTRMNPDPDPKKWTVSLFSVKRD